MELSLNILIFLLWTLLLLGGFDLFIIFDVSVNSLTVFIALFPTQPTTKIEPIAHGGHSIL